MESAMEGFYRALAKKFPSKKELLLAFAEEEAEHKELVSSLTGDLRECSEDEKARLGEVMTAFEKSDFLPHTTDLAQMIKNINSVGEAMRVSSEMERRVELFYCQIAPSFELDVRKNLYDLIVNEHKHRVQVEEMTDLSEANK
jgi:rubrerythrin